MKKLFLLVNFLSVFILNDAYGQAGMWTWMNGDTIGNASIHGAAGVFDPAYHPPFGYEQSGWTDLQGNFWYLCNDSLWEFNPLSNQWAWINGHGLSFPSYGTKGVPSASNSPGARNFCSLAWTDRTGDLWLFGGSAGFSARADLWRYNISTGQWTWMSGSNIPWDVGHYGIQGIPSTFNYPSCRTETNAGWLDRSTNSLWLFGGYSAIWADSCLNDVWRYEISTDEWTWMHGDSTSTGRPPSYGIKKVPSPLNDPGSRCVYCIWSDQDYNLWFFGGGKIWYPQSDTWKYDIASNLWTWMGGTNSTGYSTGNCILDSMNIPAKAFENKACWVDQCGKFWKADPDGNSSLWKFDPDSVVWTLVNGTLASGPITFQYCGIKGVPSILNHPSIFNGAESWVDSDNNFWLFNILSGMWKYTPDTSCGGCIISTPIANYGVRDPAICAGSCINFTSFSLRSISYQWLFPGAIPDTSTDINPANICYPDSGHYDVTLIATNAYGSDTLTFTNYITVFPLPAFSIVQNGDTLIVPQGYLYYQWYHDTILINGATNYLYASLQNGNYNVLITDNKGCQRSDTIMRVGINKLPGDQQLIIYPNPANNLLSIIVPHLSPLVPCNIEMYNVLGEKVFARQSAITNPQSEIQIDVSFLSDGMYLLKIIDKEKMITKRVVIQK